MPCARTRSQAAGARSWGVSGDLDRVPVSMIDHETPYGDTRASERFWLNVLVRDDGCWEWIGQAKPDGYGIFGHTLDYSKYAHRFAYQVFVGPVPEGSQIDHRCHVPAECAGGDGCPHRRCVNPGHLTPATPRANVHNSNGLAALNLQKTHCPRGHPLSGANVKMEGRKRRCVICRRRQNLAAAHRYLDRKAAAS